MSRVAPCPQRPFVERDLVIEIVGVDDAGQHRRVGPFTEPIRQEHDWGCCTRMEGADRPASVRAP
jgi:hypothetical protein